jgi:hypothetical protein
MSKFKLKIFKLTIVQLKDFKLNDIGPGRLSLKMRKCLESAQKDKEDGTNHSFLAQTVQKWWHIKNDFLL